MELSAEVHDFQQHSMISISLSMYMLLVAEKHNIRGLLAFYYNSFLLFYSEGKHVVKERDTHHFLNLTLHVGRFSGTSGVPQNS